MAQSCSPRAASTGARSSGAGASARGAIAGEGAPAAPSRRAGLDRLVSGTQRGRHRWRFDALADASIPTLVPPFRFFQRGAVSEMLRFVSRTLVTRTPPGARQSVEHEGHPCHCAVSGSGWGAVAVATADYPSRAAFCVLHELLTRWAPNAAGLPAGAAQGQPPPVGWPGPRPSADCPPPGPLDSELVAALARYRDPAAADKLAAVQRDLDETKIVLHRTIESLLERGARLDDLVAQSEDLSMASQLFYRQARKTNSCCAIM